MRSLKELLNAYSPFGMSDMEIIKTYFIENDLESEALSMIPELAKAQTSKIQKKWDYIRCWSLNTATPCDSKGKRFDRDTEDKFRRIFAFHLCDEELEENLLGWAKENIPKMEMPRIFFVPAYEWLKNKYGIKFKGDKD